jgi:anti-sigma regulatory factor (Ser/Thr protein kinase)
MRITLPAQLEAVERFCVDLRVMLQPWVPDKERFAVELLLREALTNAVLHGCGADSERRVHCEIAALEGGMRIRVADDGEGFDWRKQLCSEPEPLAETGRGLPILNSYANQVSYSEKGNEVELVRIFGQGARNGRN